MSAWRVGRKVGRTIYRDDVLVGVMDTRELAALVVGALRAVEPLASCAVGCTPQCGTCGRRKKPVGRDSMDNGLCDYECPGYRAAPSPCDLWPGECRACSRGESCERHPGPGNDE